MKRFIAAITLTIMTAACTPAETENATAPAAETCCCQQSGNKTIKDKLGLNKTTGKQCMKHKDGKKCGCNKEGHNHSVHNH